MGKEFNIFEFKIIEDIYKSYFESSCVVGLINFDLVCYNLVVVFVNGFVNVGFGNDKMMLVVGDKESWVWKIKDEGMMFIVVFLGMFFMWDIENGFD